MSGIALRHAGPADALCISVLGMQVFLDTYARQGIFPLLAREVHASVGVDTVRRQLADGSCRFLLAERENRLLGFAQWTAGPPHELLPREPAVELNRLYVQEAWTGTGIGKALLAAVESEAARGGASLLWLTAWVGNARALAFYARRGYQDAGGTLYRFEDESHENRLFARKLPRPRD